MSSTRNSPSSVEEDDVTDEWFLNRPGTPMDIVRKLTPSPRHRITPTMRNYESLSQSPATVENQGLIAGGRLWLNRMKGRVSPNSPAGASPYTTGSFAHVRMLRCTSKIDGGCRIPTVIVNVDGVSGPRVLSTVLDGPSQSNFGYSVGSDGVVSKYLEREGSINFKSEVTSILENAVGSSIPNIVWLEDVVQLVNSESVGVMSASRNSGFIKSVSEFRLIPAANNCEGILAFGDVSLGETSMPYVYTDLIADPVRWSFIASGVIGNEKVENIRVTVDTSVDAYALASTNLFVDLVQHSNSESQFLLNLADHRNAQVDTSKVGIMYEGDNTDNRELVIGMQFLQQHKIAIHLDHLRNRVGFAELQ